MEKIIKEALISQGIEILKPWLDVSAWTPRIYTNPTEIEFKNSDGKVIIITDVYEDEETGEILQYGSHHGDLVL